jgi:hypothetical protein
MRKGQLLLAATRTIEMSSKNFLEWRRVPVERTGTGREVGGEGEEVNFPTQKGLPDPSWTDFPIWHPGDPKAIKR